MYTAQRWSNSAVLQCSSKQTLHSLLTRKRRTQAVSSRRMFLALTKWLRRTTRQLHNVERAPAALRAATLPLGLALVLSGSLDFGGFGALRLTTEVTKARLRQFQSLVSSTYDSETSLAMGTGRDVISRVQLTRGGKAELELDFGKSHELELARTRTRKTRGEMLVNSLASSRVELTKSVQCARRNRCFLAQF